MNAVKSHKFCAHFGMFHPKTNNDQLKPCAALEMSERNSQNHTSNVCFQHCQRHIFVVFVFYAQHCLLGLLLKVSLIKEAKSDSNYDNHDFFLSSAVFLSSNVSCVPLYFIRLPFRYADSGEIQSTLVMHQFFCAISECSAS